MENLSELTYLRERSLQEFQMAQRAPDAVVARPHYSMAISYQERAEAVRRRLACATTKIVG